MMACRLLVRLSVTLLLAIATVAATLLLPAVAKAQSPASVTELLGRIVITVDNIASNYGYVSDSYGILVSGSFPGALFRDGNSRTIAELYEDADGYWYLTYSADPENDWLADQEMLDEIQVVVEYEDERNTRRFVMGGFVDSRPGVRGLKLDPPLPSRDWEDKDGQDVAIEFHRHRSQAPAPVSPVLLTDPSGEAGSFVEFLAETTPGGPVVTQSLIVILVYAFFILTAPPTPRGIILSAIVLMVTPWVPTLFGFGSTIAASITTVNIATGALSYKAILARTE